MRNSSVITPMAAIGSYCRAKSDARPDHTSGEASAATRSVTNASITSPGFTSLKL